MDSFFIDPQVERLPPESTRILDLRAITNPDGRRVRVHLELTPFLKRPFIELSLADKEGDPCGSASLVEPMGWKLELTMHIRHQAESATIPPGPYSLLAVISYPGLGEIDRSLITFDFHQQG